MLVTTESSCRDRNPTFLSSEPFGGGAKNSSPSTAFFTVLMATTIQSKVTATEKICRRKPISVGPLFGNVQHSFPAWEFEQERAVVERDEKHTVPNTFRKFDDISLAIWVVETVKTPKGYTKPHQPMLKGSLRLLILAKAKNNHTRPKPQSTNAIIQPRTY